MTYGKWKALHPRTEEKIEVLDKDVKLCKICGKPIINFRVRGSGGRRKLYCSLECAYEAVKIRERERYHKREEKEDGKIRCS